MNCTCVIVGNNLPRQTIQVSSSPQYHPHVSHQTESLSSLYKKKFFW